MTQYRKKPIVIEAFRLGDEGHPSIIAPEWFAVLTNTSVTSKGVVIHTLEGDMLAGWGDWIIKGVNGEIYPCKNDIFEKTYEVVE